MYNALYALSVLSAWKCFHFKDASLCFGLFVHLNETKADLPAWAHFRWLATFANYVSFSDKLLAYSESKYLYNHAYQLK